MKYLLSKHRLCGNHYHLSSIIGTHKSNHYNGIALNLIILYQNLELKKNYLYIGSINSICKINVKDLINTLNRNKPYIGIFIKSE